MDNLRRFNLAVTDGTAPVFWKHDGKRFEDDAYQLCSGSTLKLCSGKTYQLSLTSTQPACIREQSGRWEFREVDEQSRGKKGGPRGGATSGAGSEGMTSSSSAELAAPPPPQQQQEQQVPFEAGAGGLCGRLAWVDASVDATRSAYKATLQCSLQPGGAGKRLYLLVTAYIEEFGWIVCPLQIKVYRSGDKGAMQSFPLRHIQYDFRGDSSDRAALMAVNYYRY